MKSRGHAAQDRTRAASRRDVPACFLKSRTGLLSDRIRSLGLVRVHAPLPAPNAQQAATQRYPDLRGYAGSAFTTRHNPPRRFVTIILCSQVPNVVPRFGAMLGSQTQRLWRWRFRSEPLRAAAPRHIAPSVENPWWRPRLSKIRGGSPV
jgi:hypothetical protein